MDLTFIAIWIGLPVLAAHIARRKQRPWVGALLLTFIVPPLGLLAVLLSEPAPGVKPGAGATLRARLLFGLLPFWLALTVLLAGGATTENPEYWNAAPWVLVAAIPLSLMTLLLVELHAWYRRVRQLR